mgnify:CR=1 FL=1
MTGQEDQASTGGAGDAEGRVYRRHRDVAFTRFGDQGLIVVPGQSMNVVVNEIGLRVFELLDGETALGGLADTVQDEYQGASRGQVVADVVEILEDLDEKGAVERVDAS